MSPKLVLNDTVVLNGAKPKPIEDGFRTHAVYVGSKAYKQEAIGPSLSHSFVGGYWGRF